MHLLIISLFILFFPVKSYTHSGSKNSSKAFRMVKLYTLAFNANNPTKKNLSTNLLLAKKSKDPPKPNEENTPSKKKTKKQDNSSVPKDNSNIQNLTDGLDFLNQQISPRLKQKKVADQIKNNRHKKNINLTEDLDDNSHHSLLVLAQAYEQNNDYDNQIRVLKQLVKKDTKNGNYLIELARAFRNLYFKTGIFKHREDAIKFINQTLELNKKYHEKAHLEMLELLKFNEDSEENNYSILKLLQTLIRKFGVKKVYVKDICKYFYINKFYVQSLSSCKKAIKYDPKEVSNHIYYALSMEKLEDKEKQLKITVRRFPKSAFAHNKAGQFFIEQKEYKNALPYFEQAVLLDPKSTEGQLGLAQSLLHTGREEESYKHFLNACMSDKSRMLWAFKQAKSILNQKSKFNLASTFEKGITKCYIKGKYLKQVTSNN